MADPNSWSPKCPKCGKLCDRSVVPRPTQVFAGRLSPRALEGILGTRERCPRCATWFVIAEGTEWVQRTEASKPRRPEGLSAEADEPGS